MLDERLQQCLDRLAPHVDADALALTGGVALARHIGGARTAVADVDFVAARMDAVRPSVTRDFLVSHYHVAPEKPIVQLVDRDTHLRVDVFADRAGCVTRAFADERGWLVIGAADLLAHKRTLLGKPVDPKHWRDIVALCALLGEPLPSPPALVPDVYCTDVAYRCARCERSASPAFPLAPKRDVFALLGYV